MLSEISGYHLAGLQYSALRGSSPTVFNLGVSTSQNHRKIDVSLEGHPYRESPAPALPHLLENTLYFARTPQNCRQVSSIWHPLAATS